MPGPLFYFKKEKTKYGNDDLCADLGTRRG